MIKICVNFFIDLCEKLFITDCRLKYVHFITWGQPFRTGKKIEKGGIAKLNIFVHQYND